MNKVIPKFKLKKSIDFVNLNFEVSYASGPNFINNFMNDKIINKLFYIGFKRTYHREFGKGIYCSVEKFKHPLLEKSEILVMKPTSRLYPVILKIIHPDLKLLNMIKKILNQNDYHIGRVELSYDFHTKHVEDMYQLLKTTAFLKNRGNKFVDEYGYPAYYSTTTYLNNIRCTTSKGSRIYIKDHMNTQFVRLELDCKRRLLFKHRIENIDDLLKIKPSFVSQYISFKCFNDEKLKKQLMKKYNKVNKIGIDLFFFMINFQLYRHNIHEAIEFTKRLGINNTYCIDYHPLQEEFVTRNKYKKFV